MTTEEQTEVTETPENPGTEAPEQSPTLEESAQVPADPKPEESFEEDDKTQEIKTPEGEGEAQTGAFEPTFKYKVKDNEYDMEDWVKPYIKTAEDQKRFQTLFAKGHGIEEIQAQRTELRENLATVSERHTKLSESVQALSEMVNRGDLQSFFETLKIPKEAVLKYALDELKYRELPPEKRQEIDAQRMQAQRLTQLESQNQTLEQQFRQRLVDQKTAELDLAMQDPQVAQVAQAFDTRLNKPGAFRAEVIRRGEWLEQQTGQDVAAKTAVNEVMSLIGGGVTQQTADPAAPTSQATPQAAAQAPTQKPVITNVKGGSSSPVRKGFTSIEQLRKRQQELAEAGR